MVQCLLGPGGCSARHDILKRLLRGKNTGPQAALHDQHCTTILPHNATSMQCMHACPGCVKDIDNIFNPSLPWPTAKLLLPQYTVDGPATSSSSTRQLHKALGSVASFADTQYVAVLLGGLYCRRCGGSNAWQALDGMTQLVLQMLLAVHQQVRSPLQYHHTPGQLIAH